MNKVEYRCDRCRQFKLREFSYFTERIWICADCLEKEHFDCELSKKDYKIVYDYLIRNGLIDLSNDFTIEMLGAKNESKK